ncbi:MAG: hypothetical protein AAF799_19825 [Myxococcota bacterium]
MRSTLWASLAFVVACGPSLDPSLQDTGESPDSTTGGPSASGSGIPSDDSTGGLPPATSTTTATSTTGSSESTESTGAAFIDDPTSSCVEVGPDGSRWHCSYTCDVIVQDCPSDERCTPWANDGSDEWNSTRCSPIAPDPVPVGGSCTVEGGVASGLDDCERFAFCWEVDPETLTGTCEAFCNPTDPEACPEASVCAPLNDATAPVCLALCDPLDPVACDEDEECRAEPGDGLPVCVPTLGATITGGDGACADEVCDPDSLCVLEDALPSCESYACCTPWCDHDDPGADDGCASANPGTVCLPYFVGVAPEGFESLGVCQ